jgi:hypothetical protein
MKRPAVLAILFLLYALAPAADAAGTMRCGSRLVNEGDIAAAVLGACGAPTYRDAAAYPPPAGREWIGEIETWYYNFGPNQLLRVLTMRDGKLTVIDTDGYGFADPPAHRCEPDSVVEGLSKFRLLLTCGEPLTRRAGSFLKQDEVPVLRPGQMHMAQRTVVTEVYREEWVYNFGSNYFLRVVTLENGKVIDVENGARGYD